MEEYVLVRNTQASQVEKEASKLIKLGYKPSGSIFVGGGMIYQAMIKESK